MALRYAKGVMRSFKTIRVKPYIKMARGRGGQLSFEGLGGNRYGFDMNVRIPKKQFESGVKHIKRNKGAYTFGGHAVVGTIGGVAGTHHVLRSKRRRRK